VYIFWFFKYIFEKTDHIKKEFIEFVETKKKIIKKNIKTDESQKVIKKQSNESPSSTFINPGYSQIIQANCMPSQPVFGLSQADCRPSQADCRPSQADCRPSQADCRPSQADCRPSQADCRPSQADCRPSQADCRPSQVACIPVQAVFVPSQVDCLPNISQIQQIEEEESVTATHSESTEVIRQRGRRKLY